MAQSIKLPSPKTTGTMSVEEAISKRRSCRDFTHKSLTIDQISQLLWACQGITDTANGFRAAPSAGATYPFEIYLVAGNIEGLNVGIYHYIPKTHSLEIVQDGDFRVNIANNCNSQTFIKQSPATIVLSAIYERTSHKYGDRAMRYVAIEAGHIGENLSLQCEAIGLGTVMVGAFYDNKVKKLLGIAEEPLYIMPVGFPK